MGFKLQGYLTTAQGIAHGTPSYTAHVKNVDQQGGRTTILNQGELVETTDYNAVRNNQTTAGKAYIYFLDFDNDTDVDAVDLNFIKAHLTHRCNLPLVN